MVSVHQRTVAAAEALIPWRAIYRIIIKHEKAKHIFAYQMSHLLYRHVSGPGSKVIWMVIKIIFTTCLDHDCRCSSSGKPEQWLFVHLKRHFKSFCCSFLIIVECGFRCNRVKLIVMLNMVRDFEFPITKDYETAYYWLLRGFFFGFFYSSDITEGTEKQHILSLRLEDVLVSPCIWCGLSLVVFTYDLWKMSGYDSPGITLSHV